MAFQEKGVYFVLLLSLALRGIRTQDDKPEEGGLDFDPPKLIVTAQQNQDTDYSTFCETEEDIPDDQLLGCQLKGDNTGFELRVCKAKIGTWRNAS